MRVYTGSELKAYLQNKSFHGFQKRNSFEALWDYLQSSSEKILALRGLKRTGKTTMMFQAMDALGQESPNRYYDILFVRCDGKDTVYQLTDTILDFDGKYVFVDEVTKIPDFIDLASAIPDECTPAKRIVLTGTDSLGFAIAKTGELFDRMIEISTTYIPFSEHHRLLNSSLDTYMQYGGTLAGENYFYNEDELNDYTSSAILDNLSHTLRFWKNGDRNDYLFPAMTEKDFHSLVTVFLREESKRFLLESVRKQFQAKEYHSAAQLFELKIRKELKKPEQERESYPNPKVLREESLAEEFKTLLGIREQYSVPVNEELIGRLKEALLKMDVLTYVKETGQYYFTQPGMRYCYLDIALYALTSHKSVRETYSAEDIRTVSEKIMQDVQGRLIEDIAFLECRYALQKYPDLAVRQYKPLADKEYDLVIINTTEQKAASFEIKRTGIKHPGQKKFLEDQELAELFQFQTGAEICEKAVLYQGETGYDPEGFPYFNLTEFLSDVPKILEQSFPSFPLSLEEQINRDEI